MAMGRDERCGGKMNKENAKSKAAPFEKRNPKGCPPNSRACATRLRDSPGN
jgi:hypothetical protein